MLAIIVPYRDRQSHLDLFVPHLAAYLDREPAHREIPYQVLIVEQGNDGPFNAGMLKNVGAVLSGLAGFWEKGDSPPSPEQTGTVPFSHDYLCFHDVDYLPIRADYRVPTRPTRLVWEGCEQVRLGPESPWCVEHDYDSFFGAVILTPRSDFQAVNGYPICYWGWGYEDMELRGRFQALGITLRTRDGAFEPLMHDNRGYDLDSGGPTEVNRFNEAIWHRRMQILKTSPPSAWGGLDSLQYQVVRRCTLRAPGSDGRGHFEIVTVDFPLDGAASP